jgi:hypothetical protein
MTSPAAGCPSCLSIRRFQGSFTNPNDDALCGYHASELQKMVDMDEVAAREVDSLRIRLAEAELKLDCGSERCLFVGGFCLRHRIEWDTRLQPDRDRLAAALWQIATGPLQQVELREAVAAALAQKEGT